MSKFNSIKIQFLLILMGKDYCGLNIDVRELYIYYFEEQKVEIVNRFTKSDGMISFARFLKSDIPDKLGEYIFWVKNTNIVV